MNEEQRKGVDNLISCYVNLGHDKDFKDKLLSLIERAEKRARLQGARELANVMLKGVADDTLIYHRVTDYLAEMEGEQK